MSELETLYLSNTPFFILISDVKMVAEAAYKQEVALRAIPSEPSEPLESSERF